MGPSDWGRSWAGLCLRRETEGAGNTFRLALVKPDDLGAAVLFTWWWRQTGRVSFATNVTEFLGAHVALPF